MVYNTHLQFFGIREIPVDSPWDGPKTMDWFRGKFTPENPIDLMVKNHGFRLKFSRENQSNEKGNCLSDREKSRRKSGQLVC